MRISSSQRAPAAATRSNPLLGFLVLAFGIGIGLLWPLLRERLSSAGQSAPSELAEELELRLPVARGSGRGAPATGELKTLQLDLDPEASEHLQRVVERSLERNQIVQEEGDLVPATVRGDGKQMRAKVRIKGDFVDHVNTDKWSLRVELKGDKLFGMSRFSIQHPKTRSFLWEWLFMQIARREGLLTPRSEFVNVVMNGNAMGIYYLEEHFTKELLESQGRREGPIIRFLEDAQLGSEAQYFQRLGYLSGSVAPVLEVDGAEIVAYGEKSLAQSEGLARQLQQAIELMRRIQADTEGREIHNLVDLETSARYAALQVLFRCSHGSLWKSRRYYHDPVSARLEPIVFDTGAGSPTLERDPYDLLKYALGRYLKNPSFHEAFYRELGRLIEPAFLDEALAELRFPMAQAERLMRAEGLDSPDLDGALIAAQLRDQQAYLREFLQPKSAVAFECRLLTEDPGGSRPRGDLQVDAWALTEVPVVFEGLVLGGGAFLSVDQLQCDPPLQRASDGSGLLLPLDRSRVTFTIRNREREALLKDVSELRKALERGEERDKSVRASVRARTHLVHESRSVEAELSVRRFGENWQQEGGRPSPPSLEEALEEHGFLRLDPDTGGLGVVPGKHRVAGDLVLPEGISLNIGPGVELAFETGRGLVTSAPLHFLGSAADPIRLGPAEGHASWAGVLVIKAEEESRWEHVEVRRTQNFERSGWMATGGINFYRSPVRLADCWFIDSLGEDALNIFGVPFHMERVSMRGIASDAFDGDFVQGRVVDCDFEDSVEDAVDVSGSQISVEGCHFRAIGDKAISAGEHSEVDVIDCVVESAAIGVASKDSSKVDVVGLEIQAATYYGFAVYIKKKEFGSSRAIARNVTMSNLGLGEALVQEGCSLLLNGRNMPSEVLDVKELYRQKVLGQ